MQSDWCLGSNRVGADGCRCTSATAGDVTFATWHEPVRLLDERTGLAMQVNSRFGRDLFSHGGGVLGCIRPYSKIL